MSNYRRHHYVPIWYQKKFLSHDNIENKFYYLDLKPDKIPTVMNKYKKASFEWGPKKCFVEDDLYTINLPGVSPSIVEEEFFGKIDRLGKKSVDEFLVIDLLKLVPDRDCINSLLEYMSVQKLRTAKGLKALLNKSKIVDKNNRIETMINLRQKFCNIWINSVWAICDASESETKFIISDHPITLYNKKCFPQSKYCRNCQDPEINLAGTYTIFPLSRDKILILTNLNWVRNPYGNPLSKIPNPSYYRRSIFDSRQIQLHRKLRECEVIKINYIIKKRAYRFLAAEKKEWLYPENAFEMPRWDAFGNEYLLMPDPRSLVFSEGIIAGYDSGPSLIIDEYDRKPANNDIVRSRIRDKEKISFSSFQCEYARIFGPERRGVSHDEIEMNKFMDSEDEHKHYLLSESKYKKHIKSKRKK